MGKSSNLVFIAALAIAALLQCSLAQTDYVVGDALGWVVPPGSSTYTTWAANKSFRVGDTLVFNFSTGAHDVTKVTRANYDSCNAGNPLLTVSNGPANVTLNETGSHYFICGIPGHCTAGQKLAINVTAAGSSMAPQPSTAAPQPSTAAPQPSSRPQPITPPASSPMPSAPAPAPQVGSPSPVSGPTQSPMTYTVGDTSGWTVPPNGASFYQTWASDKNFMIGDTLVFNYVTGAHDVLEVSRSSYQQCSTSNAILNETTGPTRVTLRTAGEHYYICGVPGHCSAGQQLAINVSSSSTATPPSSTSGPSSPTNPSSPSPTGEDNNATPPTAGNSAASLGVAGLSAIFVSLIVAFFM